MDKKYYLKSIKIRIRLERKGGLKFSFNSAYIRTPLTLQPTSINLLITSASVSMASTHIYLQDELLAMIFKLLPVKPLLQLTTVCKLWYKVISSDFFVKLHLAHQKISLNTNNYLLIRYDTSYVTTLANRDYNILESHKIDMRDNIQGKFPPYDRLECYGICEGLSCLSYTKDKLYSDSPIYIWNPIVRKMKKLPRIKKSHIWDINRSYLCFGHHDDDYMVINVILRPTVYEVHIYSLIQDSWDSLEFDKINETDQFDIWPYVKTRFVNGAAYFIRSKLLGSKVVCFDFSCKIIRQIELPCKNFYLRNFFMEEYQDSIALLENKRDRVVMWRLRVSDNSYLWNKQFTIKLETPAMGTDMGAMGFVNNDNLVLWMITRDSGYKKCFLFNLENKSERRLTTLERYLEEVDKEGIGGVRLYDLTESLVLFAKSTTCQKMQPCSANEENLKSRKRKSFCCC